jgi:integrase
MFLYESGARIGATLAVQWSDVDLDGRQVILRADAAKTDLEQLVVVTDTMRDWLSALRPYGHATVWPWGRHHNELRLALKRILREAGLPCDRRSMFHRFRRTTATLLVAHSSLKDAQRALGHTNEAMTLRYVDQRAIPAVHASQILPRLRVG